MRHIGESRTYVVPELSTDNEQWINPDFGSPDLRMHYDNIRPVSYTHLTLPTTERV